MIRAKLASVLLAVAVLLGYGLLAAPPANATVISNSTCGTSFASDVVGAPIVHANGSRYAYINYASFNKPFSHFNFGIYLISGSGNQVASNTGYTANGAITWRVHDSGIEVYVSQAGARGTITIKYLLHLTLLEGGDCTVLHKFTI